MRRTAWLFPLLFVTPLLSGNSCGGDETQCSDTSVVVPSGGYAIATLGCGDLDRDRLTFLRFNEPAQGVNAIVQVYNHPASNDGAYHLLLGATGEPRTDQATFEVHYVSQDCSEDVCVAVGKLKIQVVEPRSAPEIVLSAEMGPVETGDEGVYLDANAEAGTQLAWTGEGLFGPSTDPTLTMLEGGQVVEANPNMPAFRPSLVDVSASASAATYGVVGIKDGAVNYVTARADGRYEPLSVGVSSTPPGELNEGVYELDVPVGTTVSFEASASGGVLNGGEYAYTWGGFEELTVGRSIEVMMTEPRSIVAYVTDNLGNEAEQQIRVSVDGVEPVSVTLVSDPSGEVTAGSTVRVQAMLSASIPGATYAWTENGVEVAENAASLSRVIDEPTTFEVVVYDGTHFVGIARLTVNTRLVPLTISLVGNGQVLRSGATICQGEDTSCTESYREGGEVSLTARPNNDGTFLGWSGCTTSSGPSITIRPEPGMAPCTATFMNGGQSCDPGRAPPNAVLSLASDPAGTPLPSTTGMIDIDGVEYEYHQVEPGTNVYVDARGSTVGSGTPLYYWDLELQDPANPNVDRDDPLQLAVRGPYLVSANTLLGVYVEVDDQCGLVDGTLIIFGDAP